MSARSIPLSPVAKAADILGEPWTILLLRELLLGTTRYSEFQRALSQMSPTLLSKRLHQLVAAGLVERRQPAGQPRAEYFLTPPGDELRSVILSLGAWGQKWARSQMNHEDLDLEMLLFDFCRRMDETQLPGGRAVIGFSFPRAPKFSHWWIVIEEGRDRELCSSHPRKRVDLQVRTDVRTLAEIWARDLELSAALKQGRLQLSGDPALLRSLPAWLRPGPLSPLRPQAKPLAI